MRVIQLISSRAGLGAEICPTPEPKILASTLHCLPQVSASFVLSPIQRWNLLGGPDGGHHEEEALLKDPDNECFDILWVVRARLLSINDKNKNNCNCSFKVTHLGINIGKLNIMKLSTGASFSVPTLAKTLERKFGFIETLDVNVYSLLVHKQKIDTSNPLKVLASWN